MTKKYYRKPRRFKRPFHKPKRPTGTPINWIFKRAMLIFGTWIGSIILILGGLTLISIGQFHGLTPLTIIGIIIMLGGLFLMVFKESLRQWIELR